MADTTATQPTGKADRAALLAKRKARRLSRKEARKTRNEKLKTDPEFAKAYFAGRKARANARVAAFAKAKKGKK